MGAKHCKEQQDNHTRRWPGVPSFKTSSGYPRKQQTSKATQLGKPVLLPCVIEPCIRSQLHSYSPGAESYPSRETESDNSSRYTSRSKTSRYNIAATEKTGGCNMEYTLENNANYARDAKAKQKLCRNKSGLKLEKGSKKPCAEDKAWRKPRKVDNLRKLVDFGSSLNLISKDDEIGEDNDMLNYLTHYHKHVTDISFAKHENLSHCEDMMRDALKPDGQLNNTLKHTNICERNGKYNTNDLKQDNHQQRHILSDQIFKQDNLPSEEKYFESVPKISKSGHYYRKSLPNDLSGYFEQDQCNDGQYTCSNYNSRLGRKEYSDFNSFPGQKDYSKNFKQSNDCDERGRRYSDRSYDCMSDHNCKYHGQPGDKDYPSSYEHYYYRGHYDSHPFSNQIYLQKSEIPERYIHPGLPRMDGTYPDSSRLRRHQKKIPPNESVDWLKLSRDDQAGGRVSRDSGRARCLGSGSVVVYTEEFRHVITAGHLVYDLTDH